MCYYRYWAQIKDFGPDQRVLVSMGILSIILFGVLCIIYCLCRDGYYGLLMKLRLKWYLLISDYYYDTLVTMKRADGGRKVRERQNLFSEKNEKKYEKTEMLKNGKKKIRLVWGLVIYLILVCSVLLPRYAKFYLPGLSYISRIYENVERTSLETAQMYEPFWEWPEETIEPEPAEEVEQMEEEKPPEILLCLNEKGWDGANIREEADINSDVITVVLGGVSMKQLERSEDEKWIRIELEDGTQGWIHHTLVEVVE